MCAKDAIVVLHEHKLNQGLELVHGADSALIACYEDGSIKLLMPDQMAQYDHEVKLALFMSAFAPAFYPFFQAQYTLRSKETN